MSAIFFGPEARTDTRDLVWQGSPFDSEPPYRYQSDAFQLAADILNGHIEGVRIFDEEDFNDDEEHRMLEAELRRYRDPSARVQHDARGNIEMLFTYDQMFVTETDVWDYGMHSIGHICHYRFWDVVVRNKSATITGMRDNLDTVDTNIRRSLTLSQKMFYHSVRLKHPEYCVCDKRRRRRTPRRDKHSDARIYFQQVSEFDLEPKTQPGPGSYSPRASGHE